MSEKSYLICLSICKCLDVICKLTGKFVNTFYFFAFTSDKTLFGASEDRVILLQL